MDDPMHRRVMDPQTAALMGALPKEERLEMYNRLAILDKMLRIREADDVLIHFTREAWDRFVEMGKANGLDLTAEPDGLGFSVLRITLQPNTLLLEAGGVDDTDTPPDTITPA